MDQISIPDTFWLIQVTFWLAFPLVVSLIGPFLKKIIYKLLFKKSSSNIAASFAESFYAPTLAFLWLSSLKQVYDLAMSRYGFEDAATFDRAFSLAFVGLLFWALRRFIDKSEESYQSSSHKKKIDPTTSKAIANVAIAVALAFCAIIGLQTMGVSISGLIAFGGVGGIAIGFAAKDMLANFFGSLMVFIDRPFAIGDWIRSPDRNIEGVVARIGWRHTKIMTLERRPLYVPNSVFLSISLENPSRMTLRRIYTTFTIRYQDSKQAAITIEKAENVLKEHAMVDHTSPHFIKMTQLGANGLECVLYCFVKEKTFANFCIHQQDILLKVLGVIEEEGAQIAYPTQSIMLDTSQASSTFAMS